MLPFVRVAMVVASIHRNRTMTKLGLVLVGEQSGKKAAVSEAADYRDASGAGKKKRDSVAALSPGPLKLKGEVLGVHSATRLAPCSLDHLAPLLGWVAG